MTLDNVYTQHGRLARVPAFPSLLMSLTFLTGFCPAVFDEILDATEPCAGGEPGLRAEPEPFCTACGANACIFWLYGEEWRHYRPGTD